MAINYWLDLFTGNTWDEFVAAGSSVSGFRQSREKVVQKIKPGDYFLCYVTGISRWIGLLEVAGPVYYDDQTRIWSREAFPWRFPVKPLIQLSPENAVPVLSLRDKLSYFQNLKNPHLWSGHFRGSPAREKAEDAEIVIAALRDAEANPKPIPYDEKKYRRIPIPPKTYQAGSLEVTIPDEAETPVCEDEEKEERAHVEIQWVLLKLGKDLGLDVHVARGDKNKTYRGKRLGELSVSKPPMHFDEATNKTIQNIDVLWLADKAIVAAFEIEHSTAIYSGLLRMSDLISMQPNVNISLYIVAPDKRRKKVAEEVLRPTFAKLKPPLSECCQYISYSSLREKVREVEDVIPHLKSSFIAEIAEPYYREE